MSERARFLRFWLSFHLEACALALAVRWRIKHGIALTPDQSGSMEPAELPFENLLQTAFVASRRAVRYLSPLDTCLPRSIVLFRLLEPFGGARLHYGFRPAPEGIAGHAWVSFRGKVVGEPAESVSSFVDIPLNESEAEANGAG